MDTLSAYDPSSIGPFRLLGRLGADGMGQVYLGEGPNERRVAVKVVHPGLAHDGGFRARLARGVDMGRRVRAPWTAAVVDADPGAPQPWLATEYVPGPSLEHAVRTAGVSSPDGVRILAVRLAQALAGIHAAGLVHGGVTPSNVLLAADGPRLIDFGIAQAVDGTRMTSTGMMGGTPVFMSPEQVDGAEIGPASDVFSLGAVLVFAATGTGPFGDGPPLALLDRIRTSPPNLGGLAEPVRGLVARCLARDPADRPMAAELAAALGTAPASGPSPAAAAQAASRPAATPPAAAPYPTDPAPGPGGSGGRRIRRRALLTAAALVGLGGVGAAVGISRTSGSQAAVRWSHATSGDVLAVVTDGATVFAKGTDASVSAIDVATGQPRWTYAIGQALEGDTESLAVAGATVYTSDGQNTYAIDAASGSRSWVADAGELLAANPTTVVCAGYAERRPAVTVLDPATGTPRWTRRLEDIELGASSPPDLAALSASGLHLVGRGTLVTLDLATGSTLWSRPVTGDPVAEGLVAAPDTVFLIDPTSNSSDPPPILALDVQTGAERWTVEGSTNPDFAPRLVTVDAVYSIGSSEVATYDTETGRQRWTWSDEVERGDPLAPDNAWGLSGPAIDGDTLAVLADTTPAGSQDNHQCVVIGLDTRSGKSRWRAELPPSAPGTTNTTFRKTGPVATADGSFVVSVGRELYAITV